MPNICVKNIASDSRIVSKNTVFFAIKGNKDDGRKYIYKAILMGACAVIAESEFRKKSRIVKYICNVPVIYIYNLRKKMSFLAGEFYGHPSQKMKLVATTGTNGKTTVTHLVAQLTNGIGKKSAVMSSIGNGILNNIIPTNNTTDSPIDIQRNLHFFLKKNVNLTAIEASSHGLKQYRVFSLFFDAAVFTNLSNDHLDYHLNMYDYEKAKWSLFSKHSSGLQIINIDDPVGLKWINELPGSCAVSIKNKIPLNWKYFWLSVNKIKYFYNKTLIYFNSSWGCRKIISPLIGYFNVNNLMLSIASLLMIGYKINDIISAVKILKRIEGRMELFTAYNFPTIFVDYAHTADALKNALIVAKSYKKIGKIFCVFGCGGEKNKQRRSLMAKISEQYSDYIIITNDNPRNEDPDIIINDILKGFLNKKLVKVIKNRKKAIEYAIDIASKDDVVLIAGKGHERNQIFKDFIVPYSDKDLVKKILNIK